LSNQVLETALDIGQARGLPPMTFSWKIDDVLRFDETAIVEHKHLAGNDLFPLASRFVRFVVRRPLASKLKGNSLTHHANCVHSVHDRIDTLFEQVTFRDLDGHNRSAQ
jgi:hypothetical protein